MANELDSLDYFIVVCGVCGQYDEAWAGEVWDSYSEYTCTDCREEEPEVKSENDTSN